MDEDDFTRRIAASPRDDDLRRVYADWLATRPDPRAERRERFLRGLVDGREPAIETIEGLRDEDAAWLALVDRTTIESCGGERRRGLFALQCPRRWEELASTEEDTLVRFCGTCRERVYYCTTVEEAQGRGMLRQCVALAITSTSEQDYEEPILIGRVRSPLVTPTAFVASMGLTRRVVDDAVWYLGDVFGRPFALTYQHAGPEEPADRLRFVVPVQLDADVDLWPIARLTGELPLGGTGVRRLGPAASKALGGFARNVGPVALRARRALRLPEEVLPPAPLVLVHWTDVPLDGVVLGKRVRHRTQAMARVAEKLEA